ncbi:MAG TPA: hypothetical protein VMP68_11235 [Candidatus Eisenbacteria bacterium]|nr:hypothetical protein [Candidatus Eisenbacteria bacterium]
MREETQSRYEFCVYCKQPITENQRPFKRLADGTAAHLKCYLDHMDEEENEPRR